MDDDYDFGYGAMGGGEGESSCDSISTVSEAEEDQDDAIMSYPYYASEVSSCQLDLGLGLASGAGMGRPDCKTAVTAADLPSSSSLSSSSSSYSSPSRAHASAGTKRTADSFEAATDANAAGNQVVGWPPVRVYRICTLSNQAKTPTIEQLESNVDNNKSKNAMGETIYCGSDRSYGRTKEKKSVKTSPFVKVNMNGIPIGRKVDLSAHACYDALAQTLEDMFRGPTMMVNSIRSNGEEQSAESPRPLKLLDESSEFVLTYEDKDGDWMLVGDVPWGMFVHSVKRLKIMKTTEANGLVSFLQKQY